MAAGIYGISMKLQLVIVAGDSVQKRPHAATYQKRDADAARAAARKRR